jgi:hypothetical protein
MAINLFGVIMENNNSPTADQSAQRKSIHRWFPQYLYLLEILICIPIFYFVNKFLFNYYFGWAKLEYANYKLRINIALILIEVAILGFSYCLSRRSWYRHCLRALLFFVILLAAVFIVIMQPAWKQKYTIKTINKWSNNIIIHDDSPDYSLDPWNCKHYATWMRNLFGDDYFYKVWSIEINESDLTKIDLTPLGDLEYLDDLYIHNSQITDEEYEQIIRLPKLVSLSLDGSNITDEMLARINYIKNFQPKLELLSLENTKISDAGIAFLKYYKKLKWLYLDNTKITDAGLVYLKEFNGLKKLLRQQNSWVKFGSGRSPSV